MKGGRLFHGGGMDPTEGAWDHLALPVVPRKRPCNAFTAAYRRLSLGLDCIPALQRDASAWGHLGTSSSPSFAAVLKHKGTLPFVLSCSPGPVSFKLNLVERKGAD